MSNILFVSGSYFPNATANAVCAKKFEDALKIRGHSIFYCNRRNNLYEQSEYVMDGTQLYTVGKNSDLFFQTVEKLQRIELPNHMGMAFGWALKFYRVLIKLMNLGKGTKQLRLEADNIYFKSYSERICQIVREKQIDLIVSVSMPFASHIVVQKAIEQIKPECRPKWITYAIDAYWSKAGVKKSDIPSMKNAEHAVFQACDCILMLDTITKDYSSEEYDCYRDKMTSLPLPLFDLRNTSNYEGGFEKKLGVSEIVFAGTVYDDFSNMNTCIHVVEKFQGKPYRFHFMGKIYPKSLAQLKALQQKMPGQIEIYGRMPYDFAKGSMLKSDILLNLANDNMNQIPSKIFEYMMCLKPILNIYNIDEDVGTAYLKQYPLAFNFKTGGPGSNQDIELLKWVGNIDKLHISLEELDAIFHNVTTMVVVEQFCSLCTKLIQSKSGK